MGLDTSNLQKRIVVIKFITVLAFEFLLTILSFSKMIKNHSADAMKRLTLAAQKAGGTYRLSYQILKDERAISTYGLREGSHQVVALKDGFRIEIKSCLFRNIPHAIEVPIRLARPAGPYGTGCE